MPAPLKPNGLLPRGRDRRTGRLHRQIRRVLIAANGKPVTTRHMVEAAYPRRQLAEQHWLRVRVSAERFAVRATPRTRPLLWQAKPGAFDRCTENPAKIVAGKPQQNWGV